VFINGLHYSIAKIMLMMIILIIVAIIIINNNNIKYIKNI